MAMDGRPSGLGDRPGDELLLEALLHQSVPEIDELPFPDRERLQEMAVSLHERGLPPTFIASSLRNTAQVLREMREEEKHGDNVFRREHVRRFIEQNAVDDAGPGPRYNPRRERKREERERLSANVTHLLREARQARARHEVKKTRNRLLKLDQRELRRVLGAEGDDLCKQINVWLRSTAAMF